MHYVLHYVDTYAIYLLLDYTKQNGWCCQNITTYICRF